MRSFGWLSAAALGVLGAGFAGQAAAQPVVGEPASALVFPLFDSREHFGTLLTVTNTSRDNLTCGNGFRQGDILLHYVYFGKPADPNGPNQICREFDTDEILTPGDTLTVFADKHNPESEQGWLWVEARDPETREAVVFNHLIGSGIVVNNDIDFLIGYTAYGFRGDPDDSGASSGSHDACDREFTDENDDGSADFNGEEYDFWPLKVFVDNFFQEGLVPGLLMTFENELDLASCDVDAFDDDDTRVNVGIWNNRENRTSRNFSFECFTRRKLSDISRVALGLNGDPNELRRGNAQIQTGWVDIAGSDAILGVFQERLMPAPTGGGRPPFAAGNQLAFEGQFGGEDDPNPDHSACKLFRNDL